ncbi:MAG: hypothetical protein AB1481_04545 [Candidatus Omnitrophota bacterium]
MKKYRFVIMGIALCILTLAFISRGAIAKAYRKYTFITECSKLPGAKEFLKGNPGFVDSVIDYPDILTIILNFGRTSPQHLHFFFEHHEEFVGMLKSDQYFRENVYAQSSDPQAAEFFVQHYFEMVAFVKNNPMMTKALAEHPEFRKYIIEEHPEKFQKAIFSADPKQAGYELYEEFIIEKYLKKAP